MTADKSSKTQPASELPGHPLPSQPIVLDTNVVSYLFKRDTRATLYRPHVAGRLPTVSFLTMAELDAWAEVKRWGQKQHQRLERFLAGYVTH